MDQILIKFRKLGRLLLDEILELLDVANLLIMGGSVDDGLFLLFLKLEDLISNLVVILTLADFIQELLLELEQILIDCLNLSVGGLPDYSSCC